VSKGKEGGERKKGTGKEEGKGIREASLMLSAPLSAQRCRERDGAAGSRGTAPLQHSSSRSRPNEKGRGHRVQKKGRGKGSASA
jgi:hypothetical protein